MTRTQTKERPRCRPRCRAALTRLTRLGITPFTVNGIWDGQSVESPERGVTSSNGVTMMVSDRLTDQLRRMVEAGEVPGVRMWRTEQEREMVWRRFWHAEDLEAPTPRR